MTYKDINQFNRNKEIHFKSFQIETIFQNPFKTSLPSYLQQNPPL